MKLMAAMAAKHLFWETTLATYSDRWPQWRQDTYVLKDIDYGMVGAATAAKLLSMTTATK